MNKKSGFTLAETLITLAVIGIIVAVTLPCLIEKHKERQRITRLKKVYSVLNQAYNLVRAEYGDLDTWNYTNTNTGEKDEEGNAIYDTTGQELFITRMKEYIRQSAKPPSSVQSYLSLDGREQSNANPLASEYDYCKIFTADGTIIKVGWVYESCANSIVKCGDIAVFFSENYNFQTGVNVFWFYISPYEIRPYGHPDHTDRPFEKYCDKSNSYGLSASEQGRSCTAWVLFKENMDYLHCPGELGWDKASKCSK